MKSAEIKLGYFYYNGKDSLREVVNIFEKTNPMKDKVWLVTYKVIAAKQANEWDRLQQKMVTTLGRALDMSLDGFAAWAKCELDVAGATQLMLTLTTRKLKLSPGELAFMASAMAEAGSETIKAGTCMTFDHTEGRAVSGLAKKGILKRLDGEVEFTALGAAWVSEQAKAAL